jgi:uncharacterized protein YbaR (Trm112 family)
MPDTEPPKSEVAGSAGRDTEGGERMVDPKLLEILVCPLTKTPLRYDAAARELISDQAGLAFPIRNGVPIMLVDEARTLDDDPVAKGASALARDGGGGKSP